MAPSARATITASQAGLVPCGGVAVASVAGTGMRGVAVALGADAAGDAGTAAQVEALVMVLVSSVTAPVRASIRPDTVVPVWRAMLVRASMLPTNLVFGKRVAELPIRQNTLHGDPPPMSDTLESAAVVSVVAIWKI